MIMTSAQVEIKRATEAELPGIATLAGEIWRAHYPGIISRAQIEYMLARMYDPDVLRKEMNDEGVRFELLLVAGILRGFAAFGPTETAGVFKLHKLYLHPDSHGRGLGSRLLCHCEGEARKLGGSRLILAVNKKNVRALATYERNGFQILDSVVNDIGGGFVMDDYILGKNL